MAELNDKLEQIVILERQLSKIKDVDVLLERILTETRKIVNADAGSIYEVIDNGENLKIKYGQNDTRQKLLEPGMKLPYTSFSFPISETSICGYVAKTGKPLNIKDCYELDESLPFKFNKNPDILSNYKTTSIYTVPLKSEKELFGVIQIINKKDKDGNVISFSDDDSILITHLANDIIQFLEQAYRFQAIVTRMNRLAALRDPKETGGHVERVSTYSLEIFDRWSFNHQIPVEDSQDFRDNLRIAARFHDIGKVGISDLILKKPGRFDENERNIMKAHTCMGAQLFFPKEDELDEMCFDINLHHHDRWDGGELAYPGKVDIEKYVTGEPIPQAEKLMGKDIPLAARIVSVADVFDALSNQRCYKEAWDIEEAFAEIEKNAGLQFDPEVVKAFIEIKDRIKAISIALKDQEPENSK
ncbi:MAG: GAF domain-containing protein [Treponema sp.]|nr:GAF domain-containing protein [Treponema sp.]